MKESISYSFLLNIVIVFVFLCFAIIMGMFSYHKAFRANTVILSAIEKYEGYNCASKAEINKNLSTIGYNAPFTPTCKSDEKHCVVDDVHKYKVVAYNLDGPQGDDGVTYITDTTGTAYIDGTKKQTRHYRYAVTTYMYVDIPVISQLMRMSVTTKTDTMYEFRDIYDWFGDYYDGKYKITDMYPMMDGQEIIEEYASSSVTSTDDRRIRDINDPEYKARKRLKYDLNGDGIIDATDSGIARGAFQFEGTYDYKNCVAVKSYDNY